MNRDDYIPPYLFVHLHQSFGHKSRAMQSDHGLLWESIYYQNGKGCRLNSTYNWMALLQNFVNRYEGFKCLNLICKDGLNSQATPKRYRGMIVPCIDDTFWEKIRHLSLNWWTRTNSGHVSVSVLFLPDSLPSWYLLQALVQPSLYRQDGSGSEFPHPHRSFGVHGCRQTWRVALVTDKVRMTLR